VRDTVGAVIPGARVVARRPDGTSARETSNDNSGAYELSRLDGGAWHLSVELDACQSAARDITVAAGETKVVDLTLAAGTIVCALHVDVSMDNTVDRLAR
jgi:hypothetical protein